MLSFSIALHPSHQRFLSHGHPPFVYLLVAILLLSLFITSLAVPLNPQPKKIISHLSLLILIAQLAQLLLTLL